MPIDGMSILFEPTSASWTGGTPTSYETDGSEVNGGVVVADTSEVDFRLRTTFTAKNRKPIRQSDGSYSKGRRYQNIVVPFTLADGTISLQKVRVEYELHPEAVADATFLSNIRHMTAQVQIDSDLDKFFQFGVVK